MEAQSKSKMTICPSDVALPGYETYKIDSNGLVRSPSGKTLKSWIDNKGYFMVSLGGRNNKRTIGVHRLLALTFVPNPDNLPEVNHIDGNKQNNDLNNLEWVTHGDNMRHAYDTGLNKRGTVVEISHKPAEATFVFRSLRKASEFMGKYPSYLAVQRYRGLSCSSEEWEVQFGEDTIEFDN